MIQREEAVRAVDRAAARALQALTEKLTHAVYEHSRRGTLNSSMYLQAVQRACHESFREAIQAAAHRQVQVLEAPPNEHVETLSRVADSVSKVVLAAFEQSADRCSLGNGSLQDQIRNSLTESIEFERQATLEDIRLGLVDGQVVLPLRSPESSIKQNVPATPWWKRFRSRVAAAIALLAGVVAFIAGVLAIISHWRDLFQ